MNDYEIDRLNDEELYLLKMISEIQLHIFTDVAQHMRFSHDFEQYEHGSFPMIEISIP